MTCTKFFAFTIYDTNTDFMQFPPTNNRGEREITYTYV